MSKELLTSAPSGHAGQEVSGCDEQALHTNDCASVVDALIDRAATDMAALEWVGWGETGVTNGARDAKNGVHKAKCDRPNKTAIPDLSATKSAK